MRDKVSPAVFMIDMSNVCWDKSIASQGTAGPRMLRFERVHEALLDADPNASIEVVADNSLRHTLVDTSAREWREIRDRYSIAEVPVADELILLRASSEPDMVVVSRDQFMDHRKEHPWITEQPHRFMKPVTRSGSVHLVPSGIRFEPHQAVSRMVEAKEFKRLGIDLNAHGNIMGSHWKCVNSRCLQSQLWDMLLLWPAVDQSGHARCPTCTEPLTAAGPRPTTRQLIVFDSATKQEVLRFPVQQGTPLIVGRSALRNGISLDAHCRPAVDVRRVSRQHLLIEMNTEGIVRATDLGSANGTSISRSGVPMRVALDKHTAVALGARDSLDLCGVVRIELSGQHYVPDPSPLPIQYGEAAETIVDGKGPA